MKKNLYKSIRNMDKSPHKDTGENNMYSALGLKKRKKKDAKIRKEMKKRVDAVKENKI